MTEPDRSAAFEHLAEQSLFASYRLAAAILGDADDAEDAVHDAVVVAWQRFGSLRDRTKFDAWFQRIVINTCRDRLRRASRRRTASIDAAMGRAAVDESRWVHDRVMVEQALGSLAPEDQVVLALRHYLDLEIADIGRLLEVPTTTANSRLRTARARLRAALEERPPSGATR